uniref:Cyclin n=1 Tax=Brassica oleracea var. oleracea TaxID=109376 RepID=A0A0D3CML7_BRAOL
METSINSTTSSLFQWLGLIEDYDQPSTSTLPRVITLVALILGKMIQKNEKSLHTRHNKLCFGGRDHYVPWIKNTSMNIHRYTERVYRYAHCSHACFVAAFAYILRYLERPVDTSMTCRLTSLNVHRLLITSLLVAAKFLDRKCYNNAYYAKIGGVSTEEMNRLEKTFLFDLDFRLNITTEMFEKHCLVLQREAMPYDSSKLISVLGEVSWREGLVPFEKKKLGVKEEVYGKYSYLIQSAIDYEVCLRADVFVGNSFSTFSSLIVLERTQKARRLGFVSTCEDGGNVWRSYAYNLAGESEGLPRRRMTNMTHSSLQAIS